jgi:DNA-binding CsgD family transcriptional regulator
VFKVDNIVNSRSEPGIIIFNIKKQVNFVNQIALGIFNPKKINGYRVYLHRDFSLPVKLSRIHADLKSRLSSQDRNSFPDSVYLKKIIPIRGFQYLIRGFIISAPLNPSSTQFLVLIDKLTLRSVVELKSARVHFHLSSKEFEVVQLLIGGRTNKEIANELRIAECTVKEYLRTVMTKVRATTRAGVVAQVLTHSSRDYQEGWKEPVINAQTPGIRKSNSSHVGHLSERIEGLVGEPIAD